MLPLFVRPTFFAHLVSNSSDFIIFFRNFHLLVSSRWDIPALYDYGVLALYDYGVLALYDFALNSLFLNRQIRSVCRQNKDVHCERKGISKKGWMGFHGETVHATSSC
jgi:hypothetical protein